MMQHLNVLYFCQEGYSSDLLELHITFLKNSFKYAQKLDQKQKERKQANQNGKSREKIDQLTKQIQDLKKLVIPYVDNIKPLSRGIEKSTEDFVSVQAMGGGLKRITYLNKV